MSDSSNICLSCGICCDGTLIGFVQVGREELPKLKTLIDIENPNGEGFILHPCKHLCDGCTIYDKRPKQCGDFDCQLLKSVQKEEIDFDLALQIVDGVKEKKIEIEIKIAELQIELQSQSFHFKMVELHKLLERLKMEKALTTGLQELTTDLANLDQLISKKFGLTLY